MLDTHDSQFKDAATDYKECILFFRSHPEFHTRRTFDTPDDVLLAKALKAVTCLRRETTIVRSAN